MTRAARKRALAAVTPPPGSIFRWDLDKTYLKSEFDSVRDLVKIPFEKSTDKVAAPGVAALIRSLRAAATAAGRPVRVYFLTATPPQVGRAIKEKLDLDGIEYDGIVFKNQLQHLVRGKFRNLREHIGYKLTELLKSRRDGPADAREFLFGDDWESDPLLYSLYADVLAGRVDDAELREVLQTIRVDPHQVDEVAALASEVEHADAVARIYINLERRTPPANFRAYGARLVPTFNYFQTAACLFEDSQLTLPGVATVAQSLIQQSGYTPERLANSLADVIRRGYVTQAGAIAVRQYLAAQALLPPPKRARRPRRSLWKRVAGWLSTPEDLQAPSVPVALDYRQLASELRATR